MADGRSYLDELLRLISDFISKLKGSETTSTDIENMESAVANCYQKRKEHAALVSDESRTVQIQIALLDNNSTEAKRLKPIAEDGASTCSTSSSLSPHREEVQTQRPRLHTQKRSSTIIIFSTPIVSTTS